ncbi:MAG: ABC transporter permease [Candidatus Latescibacteria bacterium]|nr:ABC transporter permease [Candidatus Latescibacterota bacterium]
MKMKISAIMLNTFREAIRDKVFIAIIIFSIIVMGSARVIKPLTLGEEAKVIKDIGLNSITLFSVLIAILIGGRLVYKEIEKRTIFLILSRPIYRWQFIVGKFFGLMLVLFESILIMTGIFYLMMLVLGIQANFYLLWAVVLTFFELAIVTSIAIFFSTFSTPITSSVFTFALYFIGHLTRDLKTLAAISKSPPATLISDVLYYVLPNLSNFNVKAQVVHNALLDYRVILLTILYSIVYSAFVLFISCLIFRKKDF